jgi:hypothetical protein
MRPSFSFLLPPASSGISMEATYYGKKIFEESGHKYRELKRRKSP